MWQAESEVVRTVIVSPVTFGAFHCKRSWVVEGYLKIVIKHMQVNRSFICLELKAQGTSPAHFKYHPLSTSSMNLNFQRSLEVVNQLGMINIQCLWDHL